MKINLGTIAGLSTEMDSITVSKIPINIEIGDAKVMYQMPRPGRNIVRLYHPSMIEIFGTDGGYENDGLIVNAELILPERSVRFGYKNVGIEDTLSVVQVATKRFVVDIAHAKVTAGCRAICPDGTEGQPCVDCVVGDIVIRVCC